LRRCTTARKSEAKITDLSFHPGLLCSEKIAFSNEEIAFSIHWNYITKCRGASWRTIPWNSYRCLFCITKMKMNHQYNNTFFGLIKLTSLNYIKQNLHQVDGALIALVFSTSLFSSMERIISPTYKQPAKNHWSRLLCLSWIKNHVSWHATIFRIYNFVAEHFV
jgi:hypothetical protein